MELDCGFTRGNQWFRYRAAAIIVENDCVLCAGNEKADYFYSVGGGVHVGETAEDAVKREVLEETGVAYEVDRLAVIHENFFREGALNCHEVAFYFRMRPRGTQELNSNSFTQGVREEMHWIPIAELDRHRVYPVFLKEVIGHPEKTVEHIVTHE